MGEVYRARDTRLDRDVALKVLPPEFAGDPERLARFRREAKTLAVAEPPQHRRASTASRRPTASVFLVMELVEGEDLPERLQRGPIDLDEALELRPPDRRGAGGRPRAAASSTATSSRPTSRSPPRARSRSSTSAWPAPSSRTRRRVGATSRDSPTITAAMTQPGVILGTAAYMSPEQARGRKVDRRADIWAFGAILFEMLTGKRLFTGETDQRHPGRGAAGGSAPGMRCPRTRPSACAGCSSAASSAIARRRLRDIGEARVRLERWRDARIRTPFLRSRLRSGRAGGPAPPRRALVPWLVAGAAWSHARRAGLGSCSAGSPRRRGSASGPSRCRREENIARADPA